MPIAKTSVSLSLLLLSLVAGTCFAQGWGGATKTELALLPHYCRSTMMFPNTPERLAYNVRMEQLYGRPWAGMHHYCMALVQIAREDRTYPRRRSSSNIVEALANIDYVLNGSDRKFAPRAVILATKARTQAKYTRLEDAAETALILIEESPQTPDGHVILAEVLLKQQHREEALKVLERGEKLVTDKERFAKLKSLLDLN